MEQIKYKNLSGWLKTVVIVGFVTLGYWAIAFLIGFFSALI